MMQMKIKIWVKTIQEFKSFEVRVKKVLRNASKKNSFYDVESITG